MLKIIRAEAVPDDPNTGMRLNGRPANAMGRASVAMFFCIHYGIFWFVHGIFVLTLPVFGAIGGVGGGLLDGIDPAGMLLALIALVVSHGLSYRLNYLGRREYLRATPGALMGAPYARLFVLHLTIIFGALAISLTGAPAAAVAILVGLKTLMDVGFHLAEHRRHAPAATA